MGEVVFRTIGCRKMITKEYGGNNRSHCCCVLPSWNVCACIAPAAGCFLTTCFGRVRVCWTSHTTCSTCMYQVLACGRYCFVEGRKGRSTKTISSYTSPTMLFWNRLYETAEKNCFILSSVTARIEYSHVILYEVSCTVSTMHDTLVRMHDTQENKLHTKSYPKTVPHCSAQQRTATTTNQPDHKSYGGHYIRIWLLCAFKHFQDQSR